MKMNELDYIAKYIQDLYWYASLNSVVPDPKEVAKIRKKLTMIVADLDKDVAYFSYLIDLYDAGAVAEPSYRLNLNAEVLSAQNKAKSANYVKGRALVLLSYIQKTSPLKEGEQNV